jgi:hypothetical protein
LTYRRPYLGYAGLQTVSNVRKEVASYNHPEGAAEAQGEPERPKQMGFRHSCDTAQLGKPSIEELELAQARF